MLLGGYEAAGDSVKTLSHAYLYLSVVKGMCIL